MIQILKRHRDIYFAGHKWEKYKPISMIITTLSARLYEGKVDRLRSVYSALDYIVGQLISHASLLEPMQLLSEDVAKLKLIQRVGNKWYIPNPVNPHYPGDPDEKGENFADKWDRNDHARAKAFFKWIEWLQDDFQGILNAGTKTQLDEALEARFGSNAAKESIQRHKCSLTSIIPATTTALSRFDVPHRDQPLWPKDYRYSVVINGQAARQGFRTMHSNRGFNRIGKGFSLRFEAKTNVPEPYKVYWQVVNTGFEAEQLGKRGLRGTIFSGSIVRTESTEYIGFHWIECFIVKNNVCVARSGEFVVNIQ